MKHRLSPKKDDYMDYIDMAQIEEQIAQHQAQQLHDYLEMEDRANERYMAQLREARTPSEIKVDAVISAMKAYRYRPSHLASLLADPDLDIDGESRVTRITPLALACGNVRIDQVRQLLKHGADVNKAVASKITPGFCMMPTHKTPMRFTVERSLCTGMGDMRDPAAVALGMIDIIVLLIENGAPLEPFWNDWPEERDSSVRSILRDAVRFFEAARAERKTYCLRRWRRVTEFLIFRARLNKLFHSLYTPKGVGAKRAREDFEAAARSTA